RIPDKEIIKQYNIRYCNNGYYKNRFIIPIIFSGKMTTTFYARSIYRSANDYIEHLKSFNNLNTEQQNNIIDNFRKVLFPVGNQSKYLFFNWDNAVNNTDYVILVEGILDAIKIANWGYNVIANLTLFLNSYKRGLILSKFNKVYLCMDNDYKVKIEKHGKVIKNPGQEGSKKIFESLNNIIETKTIVLPQGKDPDDCNKDEFDAAFNLSNHRTHSNSKILNFKIFN
ncbi:MAG: hypothetical protein WC934_14885, partial [Acidithiobacillus sp.]|uniref:hypothetical protein n=1 Tax=Acidithiobacillus sp. TaxID=1872118 RepID=UPI00355D7782